MTRKNWQTKPQAAGEISCVADEDDLFSDLPALDPFDVKKEYLAAELAALLVHSGMSRSSVCQRLGWHKSALTRLLSGKGNPTVKTIWSVANLAGYDFDVVFRAPEERQPAQPWSYPFEVGQTTAVEVPRNSQYFVKVQTPEEVKSDVQRGRMSSIYLSVIVPEVIEMEGVSSANLTADREGPDHSENTLFIENTTPTTLQPINLRLHNGR